MIYYHLYICIYSCKCIFSYISFGVSKVVDKSRGKLEVAPCFLPTALAGPYWVLDYSEEEGYALISGGTRLKEKKPTGWLLKLQKTVYEVVNGWNKSPLTYPQK